MQTALIEYKSPAELDLATLSHNSSIYTRVDIVSSNRERKALLCEQADIQATLDFINYNIAKSAVFITESLAVGESDRGSAASSQILDNENVSEVAGDEAKALYGKDTEALPTGQLGVLSLDDFFERPVEIAAGTIAIGASLSAQYPVWDLITKNPSIRAKMKNFGYFRGNLNVRVAISGSPFHFSRIMVSYQPYPSVNGTLVSHNTNMGVHSSWRPMLMNYLSQSQESVVMDVRANKPVDVHIPFILPKPMARTFNAGTTALAAATSLTDFENMGDLYVYTMSPIKSVSPAIAVSDVSYVIYAWFDSVDLGVSTASHVAITTESKKMKDERETGPVERIATTGAVLAGALTLAQPELAPFTVPSAAVLESVAQIASLFGWSRPHIVTEPTYVKNRPFSNGALGIGSETIEKLALDPKMEMAVDGYVCGSAHDDMVIHPICNRESYFDSFTWASGDAEKTRIYRLPVFPGYNTYYTDGLDTHVQPTALAFCANPFRYWRGDITFRLDFEKSQYHRGKAGIWYEPNMNQIAIIEADLSLNKNFIQVVDLATTDSIEFTVEWASAYPWLRTQGFDYQKSFSEFSALTDWHEIANGCIIIAPITTLQSPDDSDISVHVFVRSENMLFQQLTSYIPTTRGHIAVPESRDLSSGGHIHDTEVVSTVLNPSTASNENISLHYFGEQPISFRVCLKRYVTVAQTTHTASGTANTVSFNREVIPSISPYYNGGTATFVTLFDYLRYAYLGMRGSVRRRFRILTNGDLHPQARVQISNGGLIGITAPSSSEAIGYSRHTMDGTVAFIPDTNAGIEVELPFYSQNSFHFAFSRYGDGPSGAYAARWMRNFNVDVDVDLTAGEYVNLVEDFAIGEDFTFMRFCGAPYHTYVT